MMRPSLLVLLLAAPLAGQVPDSLRGAWVDDYSADYHINDSTWRHGSNVYRVVSWNAADQFLVARQLGADSTAAWTRIDVMPLPDMLPWRWGYCLTTWTAPTADSAAATMPADRARPRSGCGGHPFTRMRVDSAG